MHDISEGGLFGACTESAIQGNLGFDICTDQSFRLDAWLFGESQSRVVISVTPQNCASFEALLAEFKIEYLKMGTVTDAEIGVNGEQWGSVSEYKTIYHHTLPSKLN